MNLEEQIAVLDQTLLSAVASEFPAEMTPQEQALTHGFLVLAHAVLEEHLEQIFEDYFDALAGCLSKDLVPAEAVAFAFAVGKNSTGSGWPGYKRLNLQSYVKHSIRREFVIQVGRNHGLKASNVQSLAEQVGIDWVDFEDRLNAQLADLSTLGSKRGSAGHLSPYTIKVTNLTSSDYPHDVRKWVQLGIDAINAIRDHLGRVTVKDDKATEADIRVVDSVKR
jgi:hypothetical protein